MPDRILIVEDEDAIALGLKINLEREGYETEVVSDGALAADRILNGNPDLVLLDVMLPNISGFEICDRVRRSGSRVPILFLTARDLVGDRIRGLELGGDDYITKPFQMDELRVRVRAMLRRQSWYEAPSDPNHVEFDGNKVDLLSFRAVTPRGVVSLTQKEAQVMRLLVEHEGTVVDRATILNQVWGEEAYPSARTVDNIILNLRRYFEHDPKHPRHIITQYGAGYQFLR